MPEYAPTPPLEYLNPVQRYMNKGQLDKQDWLRLIALVVGYFVIRPYIQKAAKWWFGDEKIVKGEKAQKEYNERRAAAKIGANAIRSGKKTDIAIEDITDDQDVVTTGSSAIKASAVTNRKNKSQNANGGAATGDLLEWDDEPARKPTEGDKSDVMDWLNKWDKEEI